jgi:hypothetical protein
MSQMEENIPLFIRDCLAGNAPNWDRVRSIALKCLQRRNSSQADDNDDGFVFLASLLQLQSLHDTHAGDMLCVKCAGELVVSADYMKCQSRNEVVP